MKAFLKRITEIILAIFIILSPASDWINYNAVYASNIDIKSYNNVGKIYYGFKLVSSKNIKQLNSNVMQFTHVKTGARLMYIKNNDTQRVFDISFRTPTRDNTGVNHIIEHSVLDGSRKYPLKSPFKEMVKGSLGTFINAMTSSDYTTFPVASTNEQDLKNLMSVYLDAVFYPKLTTDPNIFKQEGWRYDMPSKNSKLSINGVVYNEMKGDYSNPSWIMYNAINQSLFPDTSHNWDCGGNPDDIPKLTREKFIETYKKNYTPSNSYIYLYGKLDIGKYLKFIDENYLGKFTKTTVDTSIKLQKPLSNVPEKVVSYPVSENRDSKNKTCFSLNFVTGTVWDKEINTAFGFLSYLLMGADDAPLKKAIKDADIAEDVNCTFMLDGMQPIFSINAINCNESSKEIFKKTVFDCLKNIYDNGFDKNFISSALKSYETNIRLRELMSPMIGGNGIELSQRALLTWIYDKDPTMYFDTQDIIKKISKLDKSEYFKDIVGKCLVNNKYHSIVIMKPDREIEMRSNEKINNMQEEYKNKIGKEGINAIIKDTANFNAWQKREDSKEALDTLPRLSLEDVHPEIPDINYKIDNVNGIKFLRHNANLNGFSNINLYFDTSKVPQDKIQYIALLSSILGNVDTDKYSTKELSNEIQGIGGNLSINASSVVDSKNSDVYSPKLIVSLLVLEDKVEKGLNLTEEIINNSLFNEKRKIRQIIKQNKSALESMFSLGSGSGALMGLSSYMSESGRYIEKISGISYYKFLKELDNSFDSKWEEISKNLKDVSKLVFNKNDLIVSCSGSVNSQLSFKSELKRISSKLNSDAFIKQKYKFNVPSKNVAYSSTAKVQTVMQAGNFKKLGYNYSGKMLVLENVLNMGYLWNTIRTNGGAYGAACSFLPDGLVVMKSMRDPNIKETLQTFQGTADYLKNFKATDAEMNNYIIGAIKNFVNLNTAGELAKSSICDLLYLTNTSVDDLIKHEKEALSTTAKDIRNYGNMMDEILKQNVYFVEGSEMKIQENKGLFRSIIDLEK
ncbi:insulinase family protein [Clostridium sp.]|jgi:presequence protease|uniref:insulinase family protein n=1 Tax=Clostridium sp. TaxID=1506 RepID=UPI003A5C049B